MTFNKFDAQLARFGIRAMRDARFITEPIVHGNTDQPSHTSVAPQPDGNLRTSVSKKMTMKDVKSVHARVQSQVVRNAMASRVSRGPVTMGELSDALFLDQRFDPTDHCFLNLPRDYFFRMTAEDRNKIAWNFIKSTSTAVDEEVGNTHSRTASANSSGAVSHGSHTHTSQSSQSSTAPREEKREADTVGQALPTAVEMDSRPENSHAVERNGMMYLGAGVTMIPYMAPQHAPTHRSMAPYANVPMSMSGPVMQAPYMGAHATVPHGAIAYPLWPVSMVNNGLGVAPNMAPAPYLHVPQAKQQYPVPAPLLAAVPRIHLQFSTSRLHMNEQRSLSLETTRRAIMAGVNPFSNYKGDITEETIRNAQCPEDMNTSVHMEGFPEGTSEADILSVIRFAAVRNICLFPVVPGRFSTAAADVTFFTREAAVYCINRGAEGTFKFRGNPLKFIWNKNKCRPADGEEMRQSRVLLIEGPENIVSIQGVESLLHLKLVYKLVDRNMWRVRDGDVVISLEFCKLRGQARCAKKLLEEVINKLGLDVVVSFGDDPCGPR